MSADGRVDPPSHDEWPDSAVWDRYYEAVLEVEEADHDLEAFDTHFLDLAREKGGRVWFPACGLDFSPYGYAIRGCRVLATDFSRVAVRRQREVAVAAVERSDSTNVSGSLVVVEHDFTESKPAGEFDLVIAIRALQGLPADAMSRAARHFHAALRPGGACVILTTNAGHQLRDRIEDCLLATGFYVPYQKSERWFREQRHVYPPEYFRARTARTEAVMASIRSEWKRRRQEEADAVTAAHDDPAITIAHLIHGSG